MAPRRRAAPARRSSCRRRHRDRRAGSPTTCWCPRTTASSASASPSMPRGRGAWPGAIDYLRAVRPPIRARTAAPVSGAGGSEQPVSPGKRFPRGLGRIRGAGSAAGDTTTAALADAEALVHAGRCPTPSTGWSPRTGPTAIRRSRSARSASANDAAEAIEPGPGRTPWPPVYPDPFPDVVLRPPRDRRR